MPELEPHFAVSHSGHPMEDHQIPDRDGMVTDFYMCRTCSALTNDPAGHAEWHESFFRMLLRDLGLVLNGAAGSS